VKVGTRTCSLIALATILRVFSDTALYLKYRNDDGIVAFAYLAVGIVSEIAFWLGVYFGMFVFR